MEDSLNGYAVCPSSFYNQITYLGFFSFFFFSGPESEINQEDDVHVDAHLQAHVNVNVNV